MTWLCRGRVQEGMCRGRVREGLYRGGGGGIVRGGAGGDMQVVHREAHFLLK